MLLLGLLLMSASGAFIGLLIADNIAGGPEYQATVLGNDLVTLNSLGVFLAGVVLGLVFCMGLALMGLARRIRRPVRPVVGDAAYREAYPTRRVRRVERVAPVADDRPAAEDVPVAGEVPTRSARPEERAAEQGGRDTGTPAEAPRGGRIRHLFGH
ncbi:hypothetical protein ACFVSN_29885 [Kitasatospora sp. NPDC057904]|uniref:hypothetical protein n=1 Tax=unclassified Kitasatospora TaxID=2633591 RepID=UPI0036DD644E